jgi:hypothetical protein
MIEHGTGGGLTNCVHTLARVRFRCDDMAPESFTFALGIGGTAMVRMSHI